MPRQSLRREKDPVARVSPQMSDRGPVGARPHHSTPPRQPGQHERFASPTRLAHDWRVAAAAGARQASASGPSFVRQFSRQRRTPASIRWSSFAAGLAEACFGVFRRPFVGLGGLLCQWRTATRGRVAWVGGAGPMVGAPVDRRAGLSIASRAALMGSLSSEFIRDVEPSSRGELYLIVAGPGGVASVSCLLPYQPLTARGELFVQTTTEMTVFPRRRTGRIRPCGVFPSVRSGALQVTADGSRL